MSHHETHHDASHNGDIFVPLTDNNNNVSMTKALMFIVLVGIGVFTLVTLIYQFGGQRANEEQVEWRIKHHGAFKDSNENEFYKSGADSKKEEPKTHETPKEGHN